MSVSAKLSAEEVAGVCVRIGLVRDVALESPKISLANLTYFNLKFKYEPTNAIMLI